MKIPAPTGGAFRPVPAAYPNVFAYIRCLESSHIRQSCLHPHAVPPCSLNIRQSRTPHPQLSPHLRVEYENLSGRHAFDDPHHLSHAVSWNGLNQKMHIIFVGTNFQNSHVISLFQAKACVFEYHIKFLVKHHSSVLRWRHQVVNQHRHVAALVYAFAHLPRIPLRPKGQRIFPKSIKDY
jgi:hypothetical protein